MQRASLIFILLCFNVIVFSQDLNIEYFHKIKQQYPKEDAAFIDFKETINIGIKKGKISISTQHYEDKILLSNKSDLVNSETIAYTETFHDIKKIKTKVLQPSEDKYKVIKINDIQTKSSYDASIFYDDNKYKVISLPKLQEGSRTILEYEEILKEPRLLSSFFFQNHVPVLNAELTINFPSNIEIGYKIFNDPNQLIQIEKSSKGKQQQIRFHAKNLKKVKHENGIASSHYLAHIALFIKNYEYQGETIQVLNNLEGLHKWYSSFLDTINQEPAPQLKRIVDSLIQDKDTDLEKAKKIFYWVQDNIKYVAFEQGLAGFIPMQAKAVCTKKYGDCKGMSSIISEMLKYAELDGHLCWVGTHSKPYKYTDLASPIVDNHMIASVYIEDSMYFLDATNSYLPFGFPTAHIQGKQVLVDFDQKAYKVYEAPIIPKEKNRQIDTVRVSLKGDSLIGNANTLLSGYLKNKFTYRIIGLNNQEKDELIKNWTLKGHNKYKVESYTLAQVQNKELPTIIQHQFSIPNYVKHWESEAYLNLNLFKSLIGLEIEDDRKQKIHFNNLSEEHSVVYLSIPENMEVTSLPEHQNFEDPYFNISTQYHLEGQTLSLKTDIYINVLDLEPKDFDRYRAFLKALKQTYKQTIVLKKKKNAQ